MNRQLQPDAKAERFAYFSLILLSTAVDCLMVEMEHEALNLLAKSDAGMTSALDRAVGGEPIELEHRRHFDLSVCRWLIGPPAPPHDLTRGCELLHQSESMAQANLGGNADLLDTVLTELVYAERYQDCVAKYEQEKAKAPRTKRQKQAKASKDYREGKISADEAAFLYEDRVDAPMAYRVAQERLKPTPSESQLQPLFEAFLRQRVPVWLKYARRDMFTMWVRIVTRAEAGAPARAAIRDIADKYA